MDSFKSGKTRTAAARILVSLVLALMLPIPTAFAHAFNVELWPNGIVKYRFGTHVANVPTDCLPQSPGTPYVLELCDTHKTRVQAMMKVWHDALRITDPSGQTVEYVRFEKCVLGVNCPPSHVVIRYNSDYEGNNMCTYYEGGVEKVGRNPNGTTTLHFTHNTSSMQPDSVILHELGHCLGMWHEHNRADRDRWLDRFETRDYCRSEDAHCDGNYQSINSEPVTLEPLLGTYDYDSIMHYPSYVKSKDENGVKHVELRCRNICRASR